MIRTAHNARALAPMIRNLRRNYYVEAIEPIEPPSGKRTGRVEKLADEFIRKYAGQFDFIATCCHVGNPVMAWILERMDPRHGYYSLEHDLFSGSYEAMRGPKALLSFAFTSYNQRYFEAQGIAYRPAKWYKLDDGAFKQYDIPGDKAVVVDCANLGIRDKSFEHRDLFRICYLKPCGEGDDGAPLHDGLVSNFEYYADSQSMLEIGQRAGFWFSRESSAIPEALLVGAIPAFFGARGQQKCTYGDACFEEEPEDDILSRVKITSQFFRGESILMMTDNDLESKLRILRADPVRRAAVIERLRAQWWLPAVRRVDEWIDEDIQKRTGGRA